MVAVVLDGGPCRVGVESTIVDLSAERPQLLRPGGISSVEIEAVLGERLDDGRFGVARAPGMLESHYAPEAQIVLVDPSEIAGIDFKCGEGLVAVQDNGTPISRLLSRRPPSAELTWILPADAGAYATRLYATLREADRRGARRLFVMAPTSGPLMDAVLDRLAKAAAPK
jgi:L-threonylcarbamoyladenylate synthase